MSNFARVSLLNGFGVEIRGRSFVRDLPPSVQRVVANLVLRGSQDRAAVAGTLWPEVADEQAHARLRTALWRLQKAVPGLVESSRSALEVAPGVATDVDELDNWVRVVLDARTDVLHVWMLGPRLLGELLPGWYEDWVLAERERVRQTRMHTLERLAERLTEAGRYAEAVQAASAAIVAEPLRESAHRAMIKVHLAEGNLLEGLREYDGYRQLLEDELHVPPTAQMDDLVAPWLRLREAAASRQR